jgi:adenylate cyclase class 2
VTPGDGAPRETEIKIPVGDLADVRRRAIGAGGAVASARHRESNTLYDDAEGSLRLAGRVLRLRRARDLAIVTTKGPARYEQKVKVREEIETAVEDGDAFEQILLRLGFSPVFRYEKFREEIRLGEGFLALDETPIGSYIEVEAPPEAIPEILSRLGLRSEDGVAESYAGLYARRRLADPDLPPDMLFPR